MNVQKCTTEGFINIFHGNITDDAYGQHFTIGNFVFVQKFVQNTNLNKVFLFFVFILPHLTTIWSRFPSLVTGRVLPLLHNAMAIFQNTSPHTCCGYRYR